MKMARAGLGLRAVNFIDVVTMGSMIRNQDEVDGESFRVSEQFLGKLFGKSLIDEFLKPGIFGKSFEDRGGDGMVAGDVLETSANGKERLDVAKGAKQDFDEDGIIAITTFVLFFENFSDGKLKVVFDIFVTRAKIFP